MRIYSDEITETEVRKAFQDARSNHGADIWIEDIRTWNPRAVKYGVEVWAESRNGKRATGHRSIGTYPLGGENRAASWTDWGWVIACLYNIDPDARISYYRNEADFVAKVRQYQPRGASLDFLAALNNINSYGGTLP